MRYVATIDCGSSNVRCVVFDVDTGSQVSSASIDWYVPQNSDTPGAYDFDSGVNWSLVCQCTKEALSRVDSRDVIAVTASGFRHCMFCIDESGTEVIYGTFNMDSRHDNTHIRENGLEETIHRKTGDWPSLHGLPRLMWLKENDPAAFDRVSKFMLVADWVAFRLSGEVAVEPGNASSTLLLDLRTRQWSTEIADLCGLPGHIFPPVVDAGTVLGKVSADVAEETGLTEGTLVTVGVADTQAGLIGVGATETDPSAIVGGTYWLDCHITDEPYTDPEFRTRTSCHTEKGQWVFEGVGFWVGLTVRWFRDAFGAEEKVIAERYGLSAYHLLDGLTADVPAGSYGLQVLFSDVANQRDWKMSAPTFMGWDIMDPTKSHKGVFFKAILENACYQAYGEFENIRRVTGDTGIPRALLLSGGAAHSPTWCQILSDVMGRPLSTPVEREGTALGAAMYAALGAGVFSSSKEAVKAWVKPGSHYEPNMANHAIYMDEYARWRELYANGLELVGQGLVKSMWQPESTMTKTQFDNPWRLR